MANKTRAALVATLVVATRHYDFVAIKVQLGFLLAHITEKDLDSCLRKEFVHSLAKLRSQGCGRAGRRGVASFLLLIIRRGKGGVGRSMELTVGRKRGTRGIGHVHRGSFGGVLVRLHHRKRLRGSGHVGRLIVGGRVESVFSGFLGMRMMRELWIRSIFKKIVGQSGNVVTPRWSSTPPSG